MFRYAGRWLLLLFVREVEVNEHPSMRTQINIRRSVRRRGQAIPWIATEWVAWATTGGWVVVIMCPIHSFWSVDGAKFVGRKVLEHSFICDCGSYTRTERPVGVDE